MLAGEMRTDSPLDDAARAALRRDVHLRGISRVAAELRVTRSSLTSVLAGCARPGTEALVAYRLASRPASESR